MNIGFRRRAFLALTPILLTAFAGAQTASPRRPVRTPKPATPQSASPAKPDDLQQHYDAARTFQIGGDQEKAVTEYKLFIAEALRRIGNARARARDFDHAAQAFEQAVAFHPDDADVHLDYATSLLLAGKLPESRAQAEQALKLAPDNSQAHTVLGRVLFEQGTRPGRAGPEAGAR